MLSCGTTAFALGLGNIGVQSALGQPLRASIGLLGADSGELTGSCIKVRVESLDGVSLLVPQLAIMRNGPVSSITLTSRQAIHEPAAAIVVEVGCTSPVRRIYQVLFDLPVLSAAAMPEPAPSRESRTIPDPASAAERPEPVATKSVAQAVRPVHIKRRPAPEPAVKKTVSPQPAADPDLGKSDPADVLRLTTDENAGVSRLKLSGDLTMSADAAVQPASEEARQAQREFAAILRGDDARADSAAPNPAVQAQETALRARVDALQRQNSQNQVVLADLQSKSSLVMWLSGLLALCLLVMGGLAWRLRSFIRSDKEQAAWWKTSQIDPEKQETEQSAIDEPDVRDPHAPSLVAPLASRNPEFAAPDFTADAGAGPDLPASQVALDADAGLMLPEATGNINKGEHSGELKVEEISDVTQEVEFWISLNDPRRAIEILEPHTKIVYPDSPVTWLYLLDLYREVGDEQKYNALRERFTSLFNARIPLYGEPEMTAQTLEDFPHLLTRICKLWPSVDIVPFLQSLLVDDRAGARAGFDLSLYRDILLLIGIALEKRRLNQLVESRPETPEAVSLPEEETPLPVIDAFASVAPHFTEDGAIDFAPLEFNFSTESDDEQKTVK